METETTTHRLQADDLFAGAGGWDVAADWLDIHARGVENMPAARATRDAAGLTTIHDDVWTFSPDGKAAGKVASPPCPSFSRAPRGGASKAAKNLADVLDALSRGVHTDLERLRAFGTYVGDERVALVLTPLHYALSGGYRWVAWEQVPDVLPVWEACAEVLREQGWDVWTGILNAEQYGVPQTRRRAFLIASREYGITPPNPTHSAFHRHQPARLDDGVAPWRTMAQALPWRTDLPAWCHERPSTTIVGTFRPEVIAAPGYRIDVSRQNAPDSPTVSVSEAGVLQSFPADFPWQGGAKGGQGPAFLQAGNAVPPLLAMAALSSALGEPYLPPAPSETPEPAQPALATL